MTPLVYDPAWTKQELWDNAVVYIKSALKAWSIPSFYLSNTAPPNPRNEYQYYGFWDPPNHVYVNFKKATTPARVRGRVWSYPGHKTDRTCAGILAHEFAHHIAGHRNMNANEWRKIVKATKPVTSYEPTANEAWAETMRIFILNPNLLAHARSLRYGFILQYFKPLHSATWETVLYNAPDFIRESAAKFAETHRRNEYSAVRLA